MIELYFDGCCEPKNPGGNGGAGVIIKKDGVTIEQLANYCGNGQNMTNNVAEYQALIDGLKYLSNQNLFNEEIKVFGDSQLVIEQMSGRWKIKKGIYEPKAIEAAKLKIKFKNIKFEWIPREQNIECDCLSKIGAKSQ